MCMRKGIGEGRFLRVCQKSAQRERRSVSERTRQIWKWCQVITLATPLPFLPFLGHHRKCKTMNVAVGIHYCCTMFSCETAPFPHLWGSLAYMSAFLFYQPINMYCMQEEGGASWNISQGEVEDLLASGSPLPSNIQSIIDDRQVFLMVKDSE